MARYADKYALSPQQSLFLAKKKWDENIYCGMRMENRNVTFPQTQTILNGVNVGSVALDDIQAILNMRDAWKHTLDTIDTPLSLPALCKMNEYISRNESLEWGALRTGSVGISGVSYTPSIPIRGKAEEELADILGADASATEKALDLFLWGTRAQLFWDGNKRTSLLAANKILVSAGKGMLTITEKDMADFNALLAAWYETGEGETLKGFLWEHAISGMVV
jgi:hypothetical protein